MRPAALAAVALMLAAAPAAAAPIHTSWLWHMHQPIYWPERSGWDGVRYERALETISTGHSENDEFTIFNSDDRVHDYQDYPRAALQSVLAIPDAGAQLSFAGSLIENIGSLAQGGWNSGRYTANWYQASRDAMAWTTSGGRRRLDPLIVSAHHAIAPLMDEAVFRRDLQVHKVLMAQAWGAGVTSAGYFPAEMCFSERLIPALVAEGVEWAVVPDIHIARACADYPAQANLDQCDPPNRADQQNPAQGFYHAQSISRGVTTRVPVPYAWRPHRAQWVDPGTGVASTMVVVPAANAPSWNEGYGLYGTGEIDAVAARNDPAKPMLVLFAHDGDNAWSGGNSYYHENVPQFAFAAQARGYEPTTVQEYLADHPVEPGDIVHVEDGGWVNADGDFGSPQFINWNWPLVDAQGGFDIPGGWAEDERNWAVLTAATNHVLTAEGIAGAPDAARIADPLLPGTTALEKAWHFLLAGHESGYMYYGTSLDMEIKATLACNRALEHAAPILAAGPDTTAPTIWLPQRMPWNPGGRGAGALWGYPGAPGAAMAADATVWTFVHDVSGVDSCRLVWRLDADGVNPIATTDNETFAGGAGVGTWQTEPMTRRAFPTGNVFQHPGVAFPVLPDAIAEQWTGALAGLTDVLVDYYVEARDTHGRIRRSPIQHVHFGAGTGATPAVTWEPAAPVAGGTLAIHYDPATGALPAATNPVRIHIGHSGWTEIVSPDPAMTWNAATGRFDFTHAIPQNATAVDFVFTDGAGQWDNNGGADWHVAVSGAAAPPWVMDGMLDPGVPGVGACADLTLHAAYDGRWLYLAAPPAAITRDHFLFVAHPDSTRLRAAPWAKSGLAAGWNLVLGNEGSNGFRGWFDAAGGQPAAGLAHALGAVLEARVDVAAWMSPPPASLRVALAAYATADGGALAGQAPCGDADAHLEPDERATLTPPAIVSAPAPARGSALALLTPSPTRDALGWALTLPAGTPVDVALFDVRGRRARALHADVAPGPVAGHTSLRGMSPGVYFLSARTPAGRETRRIVLLP